jgi:serine protease Do
VIELGSAGSAGTGVGTVLAGDGRILTALSLLGGAREAGVSYADRTAGRCRLSASDPTLDLALLTPEPPDSAHASDGLTASERDPVSTEVRALVPFQAKKEVGPVAASLKGGETALTPTGEPMPGALQATIHGAAVAGAPLLDASGSVVAVLVRACRAPKVSSRGPGAPDGSPGSPQASGRTETSGHEGVSCHPVLVAAPVSAVRSFLSRASVRTVAASAPAPAPVPAWLGIRGESVRGGGVRIVDVAPDSPAEKAQLKPRVDAIVAVDSQGVDTPEALGAAIARHTPGDKVELRVSAEGGLRSVQVTLLAAP